MNKSKIRIFYYTTHSSIRNRPTHDDLLFQIISLSWWGKTLYL